MKLTVKISKKIKIHKLSIYTRRYCLKKLIVIAILVHFFSQSACSQGYPQRPKYVCNMITTRQDKTTISKLPCFLDIELLWIHKFLYMLFTFPVEAVQRTVKCLGFLRVLEYPFGKASLFFNGSEFKAFREVGFRGEIRESWNGANRALFPLRKIGTEWRNLGPENDAAEAIAGDNKLQPNLRRACLFVWWNSETGDFSESSKPCQFVRSSWNVATLSGTRGAQCATAQP